MSETLESLLEELLDDVLKSTKEIDQDKAQHTIDTCEDIVSAHATNMLTAAEAAGVTPQAFFAVLMRKAAFMLVCANYHAEVSLEHCGMQHNLILLSLQSMPENTYKLLDKKYKDA